MIKLLPKCVGSFNETEGVLVRVDAKSSKTVGSLGVVKCQAVHDPLLVAADDMIDKAVEGHHHLSPHTTLVRMLGIVIWDRH